jgi:hypothetical protein
MEPEPSAGMLTEVPAWIFYTIVYYIDRGNYFLEIGTKLQQARNRLFCLD